MTQHHDAFLETFKKDLNVFSRSHGRDRKTNRARNPDLLKNFDKIAESMADSISKRFGEYARAYDLDKVDLEVQAGHVRPTQSHSTPSCARVAQLEAKLRERSAEEAALRSEVMERFNADSGAALHEWDVEFTQARQAASDRTLSPVGATSKGEQLRNVLQSTESIMSALAELNVDLEKERKNNCRIEHQCSQPLHPVEASLRAPLGHSVLGHAADWPDMSEEDHRLAEEVKRGQMVRERYQRLKFHDCP